MQAEVVNGPTTDFWPWSVPPFRWSEAVVANMTHRCGHPVSLACMLAARCGPLPPLRCTS